MARPTQLRAAAVIFVVVVAMAATASGAHHRPRRRAPVPPPPQQLDFKTYCTDARGVHAGETCASVARDAGVPLPQFMELNPNVTCGKLFLGQWLCVESVDVA